VLDKPAQPDPAWNARQPDPSRSTAPYCIYNIGNNNPVELISFIRELEKQMGQDAVLEMKDIQAGDVAATWANVDDLIQHFNYKPETSIQTGLKKFTDWYKTYYSVEKRPGIRVQEETFLPDPGTRITALAK
jgi:UDP-glucuronate 4-epimerase